MAEMNKVLRLLAEIQSLQAKADDSFFFEGTIPSYRYHKWLPFIRRQDNNIFFTASIMLILKSNMHVFSKEEKEEAQKVIEKGDISIWRFMKKKDGRVFNFYPMNPQSHFSNGRLLSSIASFELPCDADTSSLIYTVSKGLDHEWFKKQLQHQADASARYTNFHLDGYELKHVYPTWLGTNAMPKEYSICVVSNVLYWVISKGLTWNEYDHASMDFIQKVIENGDHMSRPFEISIHYPSSAIIIYHVARLLSLFNADDYQKTREILLRDIKNLLETGKTSNAREVMLRTSFVRLGGSPEMIAPLPLVAESKFDFFIASFLSYVANPFLQRLAKYRIFHLSYESVGLVKALQLEHELNFR